MRGEARKKEVIQGLETLNIQSVKDENEFECYNNSFFSSNFQLPRRKLCRNAFKPLPLDPGTWIITELIESTNEPGDISNKFMTDKYEIDKNLVANVESLFKEISE